MGVTVLAPGANVRALVRGLGRTQAKVLRRDWNERALFGTLIDEGTFFRSCHIEDVGIPNRHVKNITDLCRHHPITIGSLLERMIEIEILIR